MLSIINVNAQDYADNDIDSNGEDSYSNISNCIGKYKDLQSYIMNNEDLMDDLTKVFFETGKAPTEFVRITYKFQTLLPNDNYTNNK